MNINQFFADHITVIEQLRTASQEDICSFAAACQTALTGGGKILFLGNGGSAADAQHLAAEFVGRFVKERRALPALALTTDTSILTAVSNDYGYDRVFARQVEALANPGDVVVGITTSGNSPNVVEALTAARQQGAVTVGLTGEGGGKIAGQCDICIKVPSRHTARIQEAHILIGHIVCAAIDEDYWP